MYLFFEKNRSSFSRADPRKSAVDDKERGARRGSFHEARHARRDTGRIKPCAGSVSSRIVGRFQFHVKTVGCNRPGSRRTPENVCAYYVCATRLRVSLVTIVSKLCTIFLDRREAYPFTRTDGVHVIRDHRKLIDPKSMRM